MSFFIDSANSALPGELEYDNPFFYGVEKLEKWLARRLVCFILYCFIGIALKG
jgi:hypothetical protein